MPLRHDGSGGFGSARALASIRVERSSHTRAVRGRAPRAPLGPMFPELARGRLAARDASFAELARA